MFGCYLELIVAGFNFTFLLKNNSRYKNDNYTESIQYFNLILKIINSDKNLAAKYLSDQLIDNLKKHKKGKDVNPSPCEKTLIRSFSCILFS